MESMTAFTEKSAYQQQKNCQFFFFGIRYLMPNFKAPVYRILQISFRVKLDDGLPVYYCL